MAGGALGIIEVLGMTTAVAALDAACKNAEVRLAGCEKVIGVDKAISITIEIIGQVAAVQSSVEAGETAAKKVGKVIATHVIPRPHEELDKIFKEFDKKYEEMLSKNKIEEEK